MLDPTDEQVSILDAVRSTSSNLSIRALAGTGKTTTLQMIEEAATEAPILCLAFNKRIADEMGKRFRSTSECRTFNSLGHRIWSKTVADRIVLEPKKTANIFKEVVSELDRGAAQAAWEDYREISNAVGLAKSLGYVPTGKYPNATRLIDRDTFHAALDEPPSALGADLIDQILLASIAQAYKGLIDYNDQIYMPALFGGTFPRFPLVLVDECQDLSPTNHAMLDKLGRSRIISVGDPWQSIYAFRGADQNGMDRLRARFDQTVLDLSVSFRCPQAIVEAVRWRVPHFKWVKPGGKVYEWLNPTAAALRDDAAIISRNNASLFALAFRLLSAGRGVNVVGSGIGPRVLVQLKKLGPPYLPREAVYELIAQWLAEREAKGSKTAADMAECMWVFASHGADLGQALGYAEHLFKQQGPITLLTGHKAKGLEWDVVYHLDPGLIGTSEQELNLRYVIGTRAKEELYVINSRDFRWT